MWPVTSTRTGTYSRWYWPGIRLVGNSFGYIRYGPAAIPARYCYSHHSLPETSNSRFLHNRGFGSGNELLWKEVGNGDGEIQGILTETLLDVRKRCVKLMRLIIWALLSDELPHRYQFSSKWEKEKGDTTTKGIITTCITIRMFMQRAASPRCSAILRTGKNKVLGVGRQNPVGCRARRLGTSKSGIGSYEVFFFQCRLMVANNKRKQSGFLSLLRLLHEEFDVRRWRQQVLGAVPPVLAFLGNCILKWQLHLNWILGYFDEGL